MTPDPRPGTWDPWRDCTAECAVPVPCPECGRELPPVGRSVAMEVYLPDCCDGYRHTHINSRHLWSVEELS